MQHRFQKYFKKTESCWEWTGGLTSSGYGMFRLSLKEGSVSAHRFSFTLYNGIIPEGKIIMHICDNKKCVNPKHLKLGSHKDNMQDMIVKGRNVPTYGEINGMVKLKKNNISEIQKMYKKGNTQVSIANFFGVTQSTISKIVNNLSWNH